MADAAENPSPIVRTVFATPSAPVSVEVLLKVAGPGSCVNFHVTEAFPTGVGAVLDVPVSASSPKRVMTSPGCA
jgi:hypothetical protein